MFGPVNYGPPVIVSILTVAYWSLTRCLLYCERTATKIVFTAKHIFLQGRRGNNNGNDGGDHYRRLPSSNAHKLTTVADILPREFPATANTSEYYLNTVYSRTR